MSTPKLVVEIICNGCKVVFRGPLAPSQTAVNCLIPPGWSRHHNVLNTASSIMTYSMDKGVVDFFCPACVAKLQAAFDKPSPKRRAFDLDDAIDTVMEAQLDAQPGDNIDLEDLFK